MLFLNETEQGLIFDLKFFLCINIKYIKTWHLYIVLYRKNMIMYCKFDFCFVFVFDFDL